MLARDDPAWRTLSHAFGSAGDVPSLLDALEACAPLPTSWREEPLHSLTEALCHQTSTFDASYAAAPHLVAIAAARPPPQRPMVLHLAGSIFAYQERGPAVPAGLLHAYRASQELGASAIEEVLRLATPTHVHEALALLADLAACQGASALARAIMCIRSGEVDVQCACGRREILGVSEAGVEISPLRWKRRPVAGSLDAVTTHLSGLADSVGLPACARVLTDTAASIECPECGSVLEVLAGIGAANP